LRPPLLDSAVTAFRSCFTSQAPFSAVYDLSSRDLKLVTSRLPPRLTALVCAARFDLP